MGDIEEDPGFLFSGGGGSRVAAAAAWTPSTAMDAITSSCSILLLDTPEGMDVGVDCCMWKTGPKFMGVKLLPPGPHYVYWTPTASTIGEGGGGGSSIGVAEKFSDERGEGIFRYGFFTHLDTGQVLVRTWDAKEEVYRPLEDEGQEERLRRGVRALEFDQNLGPYPLEWVGRWRELTFLMNKDVIKRLEPSRKLSVSRTKEYDQSSTDAAATRNRPTLKSTCGAPVSLPAPSVSHTLRNISHINTKNELRDNEGSGGAGSGVSQYALAKRSVSFSDEPQIIDHDLDIIDPIEEEEEEEEAAVISLVEEGAGGCIPDENTIKIKSTNTVMPPRLERAASLSLPLKSCLKKRPGSAPPSLAPDPSIDDVPMSIKETDVPPTLPPRIPCPLRRHHVDKSSLSFLNDSPTCIEGGRESDTRLLPPGRELLESNDEEAHVQIDTIFFSEIPRRRLPPSASTPSEITALSIDRTETLSELIEGSLQGNYQQLLGEIQFAFILFLLGHNFNAFQQWKALLILLCHCERAVLLYPTLYSDLLRVMHSHLSQAPEDLFCDVVLKDNFLVSCLSNLCEVCAAAATAPSEHHEDAVFRQMGKRVEYLKKVILEKFNMSLDDLLALSEDGPQIIDANEEFVKF